MILDPIFRREWLSTIQQAFSEYSAGGVLESGENILRSFFSPGKKMSSSELSRVNPLSASNVSKNWFDHVTKRSEFFSGLSMQSFGGSVLDEAESLGDFFTDSRWAQDFAEKFTGSHAKSGVLTPRVLKGLDRFNYSVAMLERTATPSTDAFSEFVESAGGQIRPELSKEYAQRFYGQTKVLKEYSDGKIGDVIPAGSRNIMGSVTAEGVEKHKTSGYSRIKNLIEGASVGDVFDLGKGKRGIVQNLSSLDEISLLTSSGAPITYSQYSKSFKGTSGSESMSNPFRVKMQREPWAGDAVHPADPNAVRVRTMEGVDIGSIGRDFSKEVSGLNLDDDWFARVHKYEVEGIPHYAVSVSHGVPVGNLPYGITSLKNRLSGVESIIPTTGHRTQQDFLENLFSNTGGVIGAVDEVPGVVLNSGGPKTSVIAPPQELVVSTGNPMPVKTPEIISTPPRRQIVTESPVIGGSSGANLISEAEVVSKSITSPAAKYGSRNMKKYIGIAAIAAGAMFLWGASRSSNRNDPIRPNDVANSLYGAASGGDRGPMNSVPSPSNRIVRNNTGYSTNIEVNSTDSNDITDYRATMNTLSQMASSSMGMSSRSSLHIVDDSSRMDRESIRRSMNSQLG